MDDRLAALELTVRFYEQEVKNAREALERAQSRLAGAERDLQVAQNFLELEKRRFSVSSSTPFNGMPLRDVCVAIVRENGRATTREIVEALRRRGFEFSTQFPGRAIHTALMRAKDVRKVGPGTYESVEGRLI